MKNYLQEVKRRFHMFIHYVFVFISKPKNRNEIIVLKKITTNLLLNLLFVKTSKLSFTEKGYLTFAVLSRLYLAGLGFKWLFGLSRLQTAGI